VVGTERSPAVVDEAKMRLAHLAENGPTSYAFSSRSRFHHSDERQQEKAMISELEMFLKTWDHEAHNTVRLLRALPPAQYEFRPDPDGRSLGELTWHLAELEAYVSHGIDAGQFAPDSRRPNIERPRTIDALAPGYEQVHRDAVSRIEKLTLADLDRSITFFAGPRSIRSLLWDAIVAHGIHHRGQLVLMCRLAGGQVPGLYGPSREETAARRAARDAEREASHNASGQR
jgi:uncharacterized damage-inducible protein DinB